MCGDSVRRIGARSGLCRGAENAVKGGSGGDRTEVLRSPVMAAWCAGLWPTRTFLRFFFSFFFLLNEAGGAATEVSRVLTAPVRSRRFLFFFFFFPRRDERWRFLRQPVLCLLSSWRQAGGRKTPSAPQVSVPSFATSILWALPRDGGEKGSPPPSHWLFVFLSCFVGGCSWCRVGLPPSPIFCFTLYTRLVEGKGGERELYLGSSQQAVGLAWLF